MLPNLALINNLEIKKTWEFVSPCLSQNSGLRIAPSQG